MWMSRKMPTLCPERTFYRGWYRPGQTRPQKESCSAVSLRLPPPRSASTPTSTYGEKRGRHPKYTRFFTGDMLGEWGEDEDGNECVCILGVVTYWEDEGRYVLADENGLCNDWTLEDKAKPENWPNLIHGGNIHDGEGGQHEE